MRKKIVADTSFYICTACNLKSTEMLLRYLDEYQFHAGNVIINKELPNMGKKNLEIREKICKNNANYTELFKALSSRGDTHIEEDGEYEAIGIAIELSLDYSLHCLILDDKGPKNFVKEKIIPLFPSISGKTHGTLGFLEKSCIEDNVICVDEVIKNLKKIYQKFLDFQSSGSTEHRPCSMDEKVVNSTLIPLIHKLEENRDARF